MATSITKLQLSQLQTSHNGRMNLVHGRVDSISRMKDILENAKSVKKDEASSSKKGKGITVAEAKKLTRKSDVLDLLEEYGVDIKTVKRPKGESGAARVEDFKRELVKAITLSNKKKPEPVKENSKVKKVTAEREVTITKLGYGIDEDNYVYYVPTTKDEKGYVYAKLVRDKKELIPLLVPLKLADIKKLEELDITYKKLKVAEIEEIFKNAESKQKGYSFDFVKHKKEFDTVNKYFTGVNGYFMSALLVDYLYNYSSDSVNFYAEFENIKGDVKRKEYLETLLNLFVFQDVLEEFYSFFGGVDEKKIEDVIEKYGNHQGEAFNRMYRKYVNKDWKDEPLWFEKAPEEEVKDSEKVYADMPGDGKTKTLPKETLAKEKALPKEKEMLAKEKETLPKEKESIAQKFDKVYEEKEGGLAAKIIKDVLPNKKQESPLDQAEDEEPELKAEKEHFWKEPTKEEFLVFLKYKGPALLVKSIDQVLKDLPQFSREQITFMINNYDNLVKQYNFTEYAQKAPNRGIGNNAKKGTQIPTGKRMIR